MTTVNEVSIVGLIASMGLHGEVADTARRILETDGLTNRSKRNIAVHKVPLVREAIDRRWQRVCHHCRPRALGDRVTVVVPSTACSVCGGSHNARAVREMVAACRRAGVQRLVMVGGSPTTRQQLASLVGAALELRLVDGTRTMSKQVAQHDVRWADLVVVLGSTELAHRISTLYTKHPDARRKLVTTSRRGIEAIAGEITYCHVVAGNGQRARGVHLSRPTSRQRRAQRTV